MSVDLTNAEREALLLLTENEGRAWEEEVHRRLYGLGLLDPVGCAFGCFVYLSDSGRALAESILNP